MKEIMATLEYGLYGIIYTNKVPPFSKSCASPTKKYLGISHPGLAALWNSDLCGSVGLWTQSKSDAQAITPFQWMQIVLCLFPPPSLLYFPLLPSPSLPSALHFPHCHFSTFQICSRKALHLYSSAMLKFILQAFFYFYFLEPSTLTFILQPGPQDIFFLKARVTRHANFLLGKDSEHKQILPSSSNEHVLDHTPSDMALSTKVSVLIACLFKGQKLPNFSQAQTGPFILWQSLPRFQVPFWEEVLPG